MKPWQRPKSQRAKGVGAASPFDNVVIVTGGGDEKSEAAISNLIQQAKSSGKLALSNRALEVLPEVLFSSYEVGKRDVVIDMGAPSNNDSQNNWWGGESLVKLFLADNHLSHIPDRLALTFSELTTLDLHGNKLSELPKNLELVKDLSTLNLSRNEFKVIPSCVTKLPLVDINMTHNQLSSFPSGPELSTFLGNIIQLDLSHNKLTEFPVELSQLQKLRKLNLCFNQITSLPESFLGCPLLEDLDLSNNRLTKAPFFSSDISSSQPAQFPKLNSLNLQTNRLISIDCQSETALPQLKHLLLSNNSLNSLGKVLDSLPQLAVLTLGNNRLDSFPEGILNMSNLTQLDLSQNNITRIPPQIGNLSSLNSLIISGNPLRATPKMTTTQEFLETMRGRIPSSDPPSSQISNLKISTDDTNKASVKEKSIAPPLELSKQEVSSRTVRLSNQKLDDAEMASKFEGELSFSPKSLEFNKNMLTKAPSLVLELYNETLSSINLSMNHLTSFELTKPLPNLLHLNLGGNRLTGFPLLEDGPPLCPRLDTLDISMNRIPNLPLNPHPNLPLLTSLLMSGNQVADIASSLPFITSLVHFDISNNNVKQVPPQLAAPESKLVGIELTGNPFLFPRYQVISRGSAYILEYLRSRIPPPQ